MLMQVIEVPAVGLFPNWLIQNRVARPWRFHAGGTMLVRRVMKPNPIGQLRNEMNDELWCMLKPCSVKPLVHAKDASGPLPGTPDWMCLSCLKVADTHLHSGACRNMSDGKANERLEHGLLAFTGELSCFQAAGLALQYGW